MAKASWAILGFLLGLHLGLAVSYEAPAFQWSPHLNGKIEMVGYKILGPKDLVKSAMTEGGWSKYLCSMKEVQGSHNFAFLFIGSELQSLKSSIPSKTNPALVDLFKDMFSNSNFSLAFPYITGGEENLLISELAETCQQNLGISSVALVGACSVDGENFDKLNDVHSVHDYLNSRIEKFSSGHTDLVVVCPGGFQLLQDSDQPNSESNILSQLLNTVNEIGAKHTFLYISNPVSSVDYLPRRGIERFLAEANRSSNSTNTRDEVSLHLTFSSAAAAEPPTIFGYCTDLSFSSCLPFVTINSSEHPDFPSPQCCDNITASMMDGLGICICSLFQNGVNSTRVNSLLTLCARGAAGRSASLLNFCSDVLSPPPLPQAPAPPQEATAPPQEAPATNLPMQQSPADVPKPHKMEFWLWFSIAAFLILSIPFIIWRRQLAH